MGFTTLQQAVINSRDGNMLVSASAGSGKTTVMIARILQLLSEGASLDRMVICTFTRAAASDMREKLQNALIKASEQGASYAEKQLVLLPSAEISTIHSWCQHIIKDYFYAIGVDPAFDIVDETEEAFMFDEAIDRAIESFSQNGDEYFTLFYNAMVKSHSDKNLRQVIKKARTFARAQSNPETFLAQFSLTQKIKEHADEVIKGEIDAINRRYSKKASTLLDRTVKMGLARNVEAVSTFKEMIEGKRDDCVAPPRSMKVPEELAFLNEEYKELKDKYKKEIEDVNKYYDLPWCVEDGKFENVLLALVRSAIEFYDIEKGKKALLDYADLEHYACKLLENEQIREEIKGKYEYVFVDEYQDVNPLQERIISAVKGDNNLFLVGDVKQSIYAFRMCDPRYFLDKHANYARQNFLPPFELNDNFRSCKEILEYANEVFRPLMTKEFGRVDYANRAQLISGTGENGGEIKLNLIVANNEKKTRNTVYSVLKDSQSNDNSLAEIESDAVVKDIVDKIGSGVMPSDIAILMQARGKTLGLIYTKLKKLGVSVALSDGMQFSAVPEVDVLCSFMKTLVDFTDDIALVSVLRSALVGVTDSELAKVKISGERGESRFYLHLQKYANEKTDELAKKLQSFYELRNRYLIYSYTHTASEVMGALVSEKQWFLHVFSLPDASIKAEVLSAFLQHLCTTPYGASVGEYVKYLERNADDTSSPSASNAVKIMTIHASKGLEFPYVYLIDMHKSFNRRDLSGFIVPDGELGLCMKSVNLEKHAFEDNKIIVASRYKHERALKEECMRVLYVALTRPKKGLYIYAGVKENDALITGEEEPYRDLESGKSFFDWLRPTYARHGFNVVRAEKTLDYEKADDKIEKEPADKATVETLKRYFTPPTDERSTHALKQSVTALMNEVEEETPVQYYTGSDDDRALKKGNAYHKAMELIDFSASFDDEWQRLSRRNDVKEFVQRGVLYNAFNGIKRLVSGKKIYREQQFVLNNEIEGNSTLIQGVIDLMIVDGNKCVLVDYKTSRPERITSGAYNLQLSVYANAVKEILGLTVDKTYIYSFEMNALVDIQTQKLP